MNTLVIVQFVTLLVMSAALAAADQWWEAVHGPSATAPQGGEGMGGGKAWYLATTGKYPELRPSLLSWFIMVSGACRGDGLVR